MSSFFSRLASENYLLDFKDDFLIDMYLCEIDACDPSHSVTPCMDAGSGVGPILLNFASW